MKDALGHGSNPRGTHAQGTTAIQGQKSPKLQRRHFEAIAADLKSRGASSDEIRAMADKLAATNPGFRRDFFTAAASGGGYKFKGPGANAAAVSRKAARFSAPSNETAASELASGAKSAAVPVHSGASGYSAVAVDQAIESSNRAGRRIGGREARAIHGLLKGRRG